LLTKVSIKKLCTDLGDKQHMMVSMSHMEYDRRRRISSLYLES